MKVAVAKNRRFRPWMYESLFKHKQRCSTVKEPLVLFRVILVNIDLGKKKEFLSIGFEGDRRMLSKGEHQTVPLSVLLKPELARDIS